MNAPDYRLQNHAQHRSCSERFAKCRSGILFVIGLLVSIGGVGSAMQNIIAHGAWTVNPWLFIFVIAIGLVVAVISRMVK